MEKIKFKFKGSFFSVMVVFVLLFSLFTVCALPVAAKTEVKDEVSASDTESIPDIDESRGAEKENNAGDVEAEDRGTANSNDKVDSEEDDVEVTQSFLTSLSDDLKSNMSHILSALSLICTIILMFVYKSGFIPMVRNGVSALASKVKSISDETDKIAIDNAEAKKFIVSSLEDAEEKLSDMETALASLSANLADISAIKAKNNSLSEVLNIEVEMLYELFMTSTLPQYVKDRVGEKISDMKHKLTEVEE